MKISKLFCIAVITVALVSCNKDKENKAPERRVGELPPTNNPAFMNLDSRPAATTAPAPAANMTPVANPAAATATAPGMNPPHGQPGHKCEIPVGAPLNSAPQGQAGSATVTPAPAANFAPPAAKPQPAAPTVTAPGMNPPHGQPGHKCEIPVGAPLN